MDTIDQTDAVISAFRDAVRALYGARIERIVLFGSRASGKSTAESDYDIAVFLHDLTDRWREGDRIAEIEMKILDEQGAFVETLIYPAGYWNHPSSPLMYQIRTGGQEL